MFHTKNILNRMMGLSLLASLGFLAFLCGASPAVAADPVPLGTTSTYGLVSSTFVNTAPGTSIIGTAGQPALCYSVAGAPTSPAAVTGTILAPCPPQVGLDQATATANLNAQALLSCTVFLPGVDIDAGDLGGVWPLLPGHFTPGCYTRAGALTTVAGGIVFLDGPGVYIFQSTGGGLTTGANTTFNLAPGVCESDVNWGLAGGATLGANTAFVGNIIDAAGITIGQNATLTGRALAFGGTVTVPLTPVTITVPTCAA